MASGKIKTGDLKDRITVERVTRTLDSNTGQLSKTWASYGGFWTKKEATGGTEGESDDIVSGTQKINFIIRYNSTVEMSTDDFRVIYNNKTFDIEVAEELTTEAARTWMRLKCVYKSNV